MLVINETPNGYKILDPRVKSVYIYKLKNRVDRWAVYITYLDKLRKGALFYSFPDAVNWAEGILHNL